MKGGYQIVDLQGKSLSGSDTNIPGIYDTIEGTNKALMLHNVNIGGTEYDDVFVEFTVVSTVYKCKAYGYIFSFASDDDVTVAAAAANHIADATADTVVTTVNAVLTVLENAGLVKKS